MSTFKNTAHQKCYDLARKLSKVERVVNDQVRNVAGFQTNEFSGEIFPLEIR
jgi:hypothetical protein